MKPAAYRKLRERLGLSQRRLAKLLGFAATTIYRREAGDTLIDREAELALRYLAEHPEKLPPAE